MIQNFRDFVIWQEGIELVKIIYKITEKFSTNKLYGLINQMRRAAVSISANIAEGHIRGDKLGDIK